MRCLVFRVKRYAPLAAGSIVLALMLASCGGGQLSPVTKVGQSLHLLYQIIFFVGALIFVGVEAAIFFMVFKYRRRKNDDASLPPQIHGSNTLEIIWTIIPTIIVIVLFALSFQTLNKVQALAPHPGVEVTVEAFQWEWAFKYEGLEIRGVTGGKGPTMVLPSNTPITFTLHSDDVIHSFYLPQALYKLDVNPVPPSVPNVPADKQPQPENRFSTTFVKTGTFRGQCAELCGIGHATMVYFIQVVTPGQYVKWVAGKKTEIADAKLLATRCAPSGDTVSVAAVKISFDKPCLAAPPGVPFKIDFDNTDAGTQHNVAIYKSKADVDSGGSPLFRGTIIAGPKKTTYDVNALPAGQYYFVCNVHPAAMNGNFNVGAPPAAGAATGAPAAPSN